MDTPGVVVKYPPELLDKYRYTNVDNTWWYESVYEHWTEKLESLGFTNIEIRFSGFHSQGDGASFKARHNGKTIYWSGHYCHGNTMYCDESDALKGFARALAADLYWDLKKEYEYLTSDEAVIESIEANGYAED